MNLSPYSDETIRAFLKSAETYADRKGERIYRRELQARLMRRLAVKKGRAA